MSSNKPQSPASEAVQQKRFFIPKESLKYDEIKDKLGSDIGYGVTYKGTYQGRPVAIKIIKVSIDFKALSQSQVALMNQIECSMGLHHENFLPYLGWSHDDDYLYIVSTYCDKGGLKDLLKKEEIPQTLKVKIAEDVARGLMHLHDNDVVHRDMKTSNVMIADNSVAQVYDIGIAKLAREKEKQVAVPRPSLDVILRPSIELLKATADVLGKLTNTTPERKSVDLISVSCSGNIETVMYPWMPPELTKSNKYSPSSDVYGYGCILFELLTGKQPYDFEIQTGSISANEIWTLKEAGTAPLVPNEQDLQKDPINRVLLHVMHKCLNADPDQRPSCFEIMSMLREVSCHVFHVSYDVKSNYYPSLSEALKVRSCVPSTEKVAIFVHSGSYKENEDLFLDMQNTSIVGQKGSLVHGHFLTISKNDIEIDGMTFEGEHEDFHLNIAFCSPTIKRCNIHGSIMLFGDKGTHPIICYNVITNPTMISNILQFGEFKHNQFKMLQGKQQSKKKVFNSSSLDAHSAMGLAHALENKEVSEMNLSDHHITDSIVKYIAISLAKCNKIIKLDLSLNKITDAGAAHLAEAIEANNTIEYLDLSGNSIGKHGAKRICMALQKNTSLNRINLSYNHVGSKGGAYFANFLLENKKLRYLDLSYNQLGDAGCRDLLSSLMKNDTLLHLCIAHNEITPTMEQNIQAFQEKYQQFKILM